MYRQQHPTFFDRKEMNPDKYFTDNDRDNIINTHNNVKNFYKDVKSVFRMKK